MRWSWRSVYGQHNVTFRSLGKHSPNQVNGTYQLRFSKRGTYHYLCTIHHFKGKVVVS